MKLQSRTFQIFWDVHAWAGVVSALVLYAIFFAGAFALFHPELDAWGEPSAAATRGRGAPTTLQPLFEQLVRDRNVIGKDEVGFSIGNPLIDVYWDAGAQHARYSLERARFEAPRTELGGFLYELHYLGPIPNGIYVAGVAALALLLALVTGVLIQLKDLVRHWFQFRPERVRRTWSSDMHKVLGVLGLPYQIFYAWSGAVLCLTGISVEPAFSAFVFRGDEHAAQVARGDLPAAPTPSGRRSQQLPNLDRLLVSARATVPGLTPNWLSIEHVGDEASTATIYGAVSGIAFGSAVIQLRARDGALLHATTPHHATALQNFEGWFYGLHYARFGGHGIKFVYALLAFATCAVIATGNVVWLERRDKARAHAGNRFLERLTVGCCAGLPLAIGALFVANRLLPAELSQRPTLEQTLFWIVWALALLVSFARVPVRRLCASELIVAGALFALAVACDASLHARTITDPLHLAVDASLLTLAAGFLLGGMRLRR